MTYHADVHEEDGSYWAQVRELPGCFASGDDVDELREAVTEAVDMCLPVRDRLVAVFSKPTIVLEGFDTPDREAKRPTAARQ
jgi:predicted RNase H-like HicB family nuclease